MVSDKVLKSLLDYAKWSLHRAVDAIFGKVGRASSEEVLLID